MKHLVDLLATQHSLDTKAYHDLLKCDNDTTQYLRNKAVSTVTKVTGHGIFVRGLIEISNYCHNNCYYCGLRRDNLNIQRYRLTDDEIVNSCIKGYNMGLRTFVLQGGEDFIFTDNRLVALITTIKSQCPEAAITLSLGERSHESYLKLYESGVSRYLLRHEAANDNLYTSLHPTDMSLDKRLDCINSLLTIGYQIGIGMMIGAPNQTIDHLVDDLLFIERLKPHMIGIGPFIPQCDTPFGNHKAGDLELTLKIIAILRLMHPNALIPATTALATLSNDGHILGILSGANVIMPNITPARARGKYAIYDNKAYTNSQSAEGLDILEQELNAIGYHIDYSRGDYNNNDNI